MKVITHDNTPEPPPPPPPPEKTYDLLGLTEKQFRLLLALTGHCNGSLGLYDSLAVERQRSWEQDRVTLLDSGKEPIGLRVETLMPSRRHPWIQR